MISVDGYSMRASISLTREMPEGVYKRALKARAEVVEGEVNDLLWDLAVHRYALQRVIDALWDLDKYSTMHLLPSKRKSIIELRRLKTFAMSEEDREFISGKLIARRVYVVL